MLDDSYKKKHPKPIPIGKQEYAYQCEDLYFDFSKMHGSILIDGYAPGRHGKFPYPNEERKEVDKYELELRHQYNGIDVTLQKKYKDGRIGFYTTFLSFSDLVNRIFEGYPANSWIREAPEKMFKESKK